MALEILDVDLGDFLSQLVPLKEEIRQKLSEGDEGVLQGEVNTFLLRSKLGCDFPSTDVGSVACMRKYFTSDWLPNVTTEIHLGLAQNLQSLRQNLEKDAVMFTQPRNTEAFYEERLKLYMSPSTDPGPVPVTAETASPSNEMAVLKILGYDTPFNRELRLQQSAGVGLDGTTPSTTTLDTSLVLKHNPVLLSNTKWLFVSEVLQYLPTIINAQHCRETANTWGLLHKLRGYPFLQHFASWEELKEHYYILLKSNSLQPTLRGIDTSSIDQDVMKWKETFDASESLQAFDNALNVAALFQFFDRGLRFKGLDEQQCEHIGYLMLCNGSKSRRGVEYKMSETFVRGDLNNFSRVFPFPANNSYMVNHMLTECKLKGEVDQVSPNAAEILQQTLHDVAAATGMYSTHSLHKWWKQSVLRETEYQNEDLPVVPAYLKFKCVPIPLGDDEEGVRDTFTTEDYRNAWLNNIWERDEWPIEQLETKIAEISFDMHSSMEPTAESFEKGFFSEEMATESEFKKHAAAYALMQMKKYLEQKRKYDQVVNASPVEDYDAYTILSRKQDDLSCGSYAWETDQMTLPELQKKLQHAIDDSKHPAGLDPDLTVEGHHEAFLKRMFHEEAKQSLQATTRAARWFQRGIFLCNVVHVNMLHHRTSAEGGSWTPINTPCIFGFARIIIPLHVTADGDKRLVVVVVTRSSRTIKFCFSGSIKQDEGVVCRWLFNSLKNEWNYVLENNLKEWCDTEAVSAWTDFITDWDDELKSGTLRKITTIKKYCYFQLRNADNLGGFQEADTSTLNILYESLVKNTARCKTGRLKSRRREEHFKFMFQRVQWTLCTYPKNNTLNAALLHILSASHVEAKAIQEDAFYTESSRVMFYAVICTLEKNIIDQLDERSPDYSHDIDYSLAPTNSAEKKARAEKEAATEAVDQTIHKIFNSVLVWVQHLVLSKLKYHDPSDQKADKSNYFVVPRAGRSDSSTQLLSTRWNNIPNLDKIVGPLHEGGTPKLDKFMDFPEQDKHQEASEEFIMRSKVVIQAWHRMAEELHVDEQRNLHPRENEAQYIDDYIGKRPSDNWADIPLGPHKPRRVAMPVLHDDATEGENSATDILPPDSPKMYEPPTPLSSPTSKASPEADDDGHHSGNLTAGTSSRSSSSSSSAGAASSAPDDALPGASPASPKSGSGDDTCDRTCPVWRKV